MGEYEVALIVVALIWPMAQIVAVRGSTSQSAVFVVLAGHALNQAVAKRNSALERA